MNPVTINNRIKCLWRQCMAGGSLMDDGRCPFRGLWWQEDCPGWKEKMHMTVAPKCFAVSKIQEIKSNAETLGNFPGRREILNRLTLSLRHLKLYKTSEKDLALHLQNAQALFEEADKNAKEKKHEK